MNKFNILEFWDRLGCLTIIFIIIIISIIIGGCQTERINRQLRLSKRHLNRAIELGAKIDSVKVEKTSTGNITGITEKDSTIAKIDTASVIKNINQFDQSFDLQNDTRSHLIAGSGIIQGQKTKAIKDLQKDLCPNDSVNKHLSISIIVGAHEYEIPVTIMAYSKAGKAGYDFKVEKTQFEYVTEEVTANIQPSNCIQWWKIALYMLACLIVGIVIGKVMKF